MGEVFASVLSSLGATGVAAYLARNWLAERLRQSIKHEYDQKLEHLKAQLVTENALTVERAKADISRESAVLGVAHKSLGESVAIAQSRRVEGIAELWTALLNVRNNFPAIFTFMDALLEEEYPSLQDHTFKTFDPNVTADTVRDLVGDNVNFIESVRPFVGDYLWFLFHAYQGIHIRIATLYINDRARGRYTPWYRNDATIGLLGSVATTDEMQRFVQLRHGQIHSMRQLIEAKFLREANRMISGQAIGASTAEAAARIAQAVVDASEDRDATLRQEPV